MSEDTIRKAHLGTMIIYVAALAPDGKEVSGAGTVLNGIAASGLFVCLVSYVRAWKRGHRWETIHGYFRDVQIVFTHATVGMLCIFCEIFLSSPDQISEGLVWYLFVIVAIAVHQFVRAARRVTAKWRTIADVVQGLHDSTATAQRFSAKYDIGFFVGMSIVTSIVSQFVGSDPVLLVGGVINALSFPYVLGSMVSQRVVLARLLPNDMPLADWPPRRVTTDER